MKLRLSIILILLLSVLLLAGQQNVDCPQGDLPCLEKNFNTLVNVSIDQFSYEPILDEEEINEILEKTSTYFDPICVSFSMCEYNVMVNHSYDKIEAEPVELLKRISKMEKLNSKPHRINIFFISSIDSIIGGYGEQHGLLKPDSINVWVEIADHREEIAENLAHELGHLFGLLDTYNESAPWESSNGANCSTTGDYLCDTPADPYNRRYLIDGEAVPPTPYIDTTTCEFIYQPPQFVNETFSPDVNNMMSEYPCKCRFSCEQFYKMADTYDKAIIKPY